MISGVSRRLRVGVAMSGGVDSCVTAYLLARQGYEVLGIHMRNWDQRDENGVCQSEKDWEDVKNAVKCLPGNHPDPIELNFVKEYWQTVFTPFVEDYASGTTPNPDVACNREIKFKVFKDSAFDIGVDAVATGHYARLSTDNDYGSGPLLTTARDTFKDQTYFLSQVSSKSLKDVLFPLGEFENKQQVRDVAVQAGFAVANKRESMGICFIGKRRFGDFIGEYVNMTPGKFISIETGLEVGSHVGAEAYTIGQGAKIGGAVSNQLRWFVCDKNVSTGEVLVAPGANHKSLFCDELFIKNTDFLWSQRDDEDFHENQNIFGGCNQALQCSFRLRHGQPLSPCTVYKDESFMRVRFRSSMRAVSPGQVLVLYAPVDDGNICLGGGPIYKPGKSHYETGRAGP